MKAVIETGGKQYYVEEGSIIYTEKLNADVDSILEFDKVVMLNNVYGHPYIDKAKVKGKIVKHGKQKKIIIYKHVQKSTYHKKQGHRQPYTKIEIIEITTK